MQSCDEEVLYHGCTLHDLGLTGRFEGDLRFEIQEAEAAKTFLEQQGYAKSKAEIVWDGIAMRASRIGHYSLNHNQWLDPDGNAEAAHFEGASGFGALNNGSAQEQPGGNPQIEVSARVRF